MKLLKIADQPQAIRENIQDDRPHRYPIRYTFYLTVAAEPGKEAP